MIGLLARRRARRIRELKARIRELHALEARADLIAETGRRDRAAREVAEAAAETAEAEAARLREAFDESGRVADTLAGRIKTLEGTQQHLRELLVDYARRMRQFYCDKPGERGLDAAEVQRVEGIVHAATWAVALFLIATGEVADDDAASAAARRLARGPERPGGTPKTASV